MYGKEHLGWAEIEPDTPVIAGSIGTWKLTYHVGSLGIDDGGTIKIALRFASDWGTPQNSDPSALNYFTVTTTGVSKLKAHFDRKGYVRPWQKAVVIDVLDDALAPGDTVAVTFGEGAGAEAQTFCEKTFEFKVAVDCFGAGVFQELPEQPEFEITSGPPAKLVLISPTEVVAGEHFWLGVKLEDLWGNPCRGFEGMVKLDVTASVAPAPECRERTPFVPPGCTPAPFRNDRRSFSTELSVVAGVTRIEGVTCDEPGVIRIHGTCGDLHAVSPPIKVLGEMPEFRSFWGDLHGQSEETIGTNTIEDYFEFARDSALLDFAGHQGNDFQITPEFWQRVKETAKRSNEPGQFVTIPGYEWSAVRPNGGDRNVHFLEDDPEIFRSSRWQTPDAPSETEANDARELFNRLRGVNAIVIPHVGGRPADLEFHDEELEPLIEVASAWGQFEWMIEDAIRLGHTVGFCAGSDDHKGRPGASYPGRSFFGWYGGLTCVYARELTRESLFEALRARRCYATNGCRMILHVTCDGRPMGSEYSTKGPRHVRIEAAGSAPIERIDLFRNLDLLASWPENPERDPNRIRVSWGGARIRGRGRIADWDGHLELTKGSIISAEPYALDSPAEIVKLEGDRRVSWRSCTAGDDDGVILKLDQADDADIRFHSQIVTTSVRVSDARKDPIRVGAGGVGLHVTFEALPIPCDEALSVLEYVDESMLDTRTAYWVRVTQGDGGLAWSSPIYVRRDS